MMPWTVSGTSTSPSSSRQTSPSWRRSPRSRSMRTYSSATERVALGTAEERQLHLGREHRLGEELADQPGRVLVGERRERERDRVRLASAPARSSRRAAPGERCRRRAAARPRPGRRARRRNRAARRRPSARSSNTSTVGRCSATASRKRRHAANVSPRPSAPARTSPSSPSSGRRWPISHGGIVRPDEHRVDGFLELGCRLLGGVAFEHARLGLHHLAERPVA